MAEIMVETTNLTKRYGNLAAVNGVNMTVEKGAIVGLVGKNGAGKTTLIRLLTGLIKPTGGTFEIMPGQTRKNTSVAAIVERPSLYRNMTAMENLRAQCLLLDIPADEEFLRMTLRIVGLVPSRQKVKNFSLGMQQRLTIAMTFVGKPQLLLLDEPTNGLDPQGIFEMREAFVRMNKEFGTTIIISSHILSELSKFVTEFYFMNKGSVIKHASAEEINHLTTKRLRLTVDNVEKAQEVLEKLGKTEIHDDTVDFLGEAQPTEVLLALSQEGVNVLDFEKVGDSLERYFLDLIGGAK